MAVYEININVGGGTGSGDGTGSNTLETAGLGAVVGGGASTNLVSESARVAENEKNRKRTLFGKPHKDDFEINNIKSTEGRKSFLKKRVNSTYDRVEVTGYDHEGNILTRTTSEEITNTSFNKQGTAFAGALAVKAASAAVSNTMKWNSATATSTAQKQAINNYNNAMTGVGFISRGAGYMYAGMAVAGPLGAGVGFAVNAGVTIAGLAVDNGIRQYEQKVNRISSANQMTMLGSATYGRSRGE